MMIFSRFHNVFRAGWFMMGWAWAEVSLDRIVAVVNQDIITQSELDKELTRIEKRLQKNNATSPPRSVLVSQVLAQMVDEMLQKQRAQALGLRVDDVTLDETLRRVIADSGLTLEDFIANAEAEGYTFAEFRERLRDEILLNRLWQNDIGERIVIAEAEVQGLLAAAAPDVREYRLRHLMIGVNDPSNAQEVAQKRQKIEALRQQIINGADFSTLAIRESTGPQALQGGDLGFRRREQVPTLFVPVLNTLQPGQVSPVLENASGFHLVYLEAIRGENSPVQTFVQLRHILTTGSNAKREIETAAARLRGGDSFERVARVYSQDSESRERGGLLGWVLLNELDESFAQNVKKLKKGELSSPFQSRFGWHIVEVLDVREQKVVPLTREQAFLLLQERKLEEERELWLRQLRAESYLDLRL